MAAVTKAASTHLTTPPTPNIVYNTYPPPQVSNEPDRLHHTPQHRSKPHTLPNGEYFNPWSTWRVNSFSGVLTWQKQRFTNPDIQKPPAYKQKQLYTNGVDYHVDLTKVDNDLPVVKPDFATQPVPAGTIKYTWIGHATVLVQMGTLNILTDPVFSKRVSPVWFAGPARYRPVPCEISQLPPIDIICMSHNHYDHLDRPSVQQLVKHNKSINSDRVTKWFVPSKLETWFYDNTSIDKHNIVPLGWWDQYDSATGKTTDIAAAGKDSASDSKTESFQVTGLPAQHWSQRGVRDRNKSLWCGFMFQHAGLKTYYTGDTGYCPAFKQINDQFGGVDLAVIPIGAYLPKWFMGPQHIDPQDAVKIHVELEAKRSMAVHWGTFDLADEPASLPPAELRGELDRLGLKVDEFIVPVHGYTHELRF